MKLSRSPAPNFAWMFVAPALQMALILIFFLLMSTTFMLQPGIAVSVPKSSFVLTPRHSPGVVSITSVPVPAIFFEDEEVSAPALRETLRKARGRIQTIIIQADRRAPYEQIAQVMNAALELGFPVVLATAEESEAR